MIHYFPCSKQAPSLKFSILIPTWNNLDYLKLCIESIRKNSHYQHQIIVHVNEGVDGTLEWVKQENIDHTHTTENVGICWAMNAAYSLAKTDIIVYFNDDMYALPEWDFYIQQEIDSIGHPYFYLSATMIEPRGNGSNPCVIAPFSYGDSVKEFREEDLLKSFKGFVKDDWNGASWPPSIMHRLLWDQIGGYSIEFTPGMYSDPDISMKLWIAGVRIYKGIGKSRVYHFMTKSTQRLPAKSKGRKIFKDKWKISAGKFSKRYLLRGSKYTGELKEPKKPFLFNFMR
jgi:glycosyltransferase involved in cell wall biosynthesis